VIVYDVDGPLFFGAANRAMEALHEIADRAKVVILRLDGVPAMDATGLVALESALERLHGNRALAILTGVSSQPRGVLERAGIREQEGRLLIKPDFMEALDAATDYMSAQGKR
jgi:SulP family sulfate permease